MAYATPEQLAAELRISVTAANQARLQACLDAAAAEIDHYVDRFADDPVPPGDALAQRVNLVRGLEWFKANDSAFGFVGFDQVGALQAPRDTFARHGRELIPLKQLFGVA